jgi:hypothetical protein
MNMISYKVIALILEPYRNATSSQAAIKTSETTNPQPDHLENVDVEYEYESFENEELQENEDEEPVIASPRRSDRLANIAGETPCDDLIPTAGETFPKKKVQTEANTDFDDDDEYDIAGDKTKYNKGGYIGDSFDESKFAEGDFVRGNLNGRSVQNNTAKNYANFLFRNENKGKVKINESANNRHLNTFKNHLINKVYPKYGINMSIMSKSTTGNSWRPDLKKMAGSNFYKQHFFRLSVIIHIPYLIIFRRVN